MKNFVMSSVAAVAMGAAAAASAAPVTTSPGIGTMNVTAVVTAGCTDLTVGNLDFGTNPAASTTVDVPVDILVTCNSNTSYTIELDYGANEVGVGQRQVTNDDNGEFIDYEIFQPAANGGAATSLPWGTAAQGAEFVGTGTGGEQTLTATGRLQLTETNAAGTYTDIVTVTLSF